MSRRQWNFLIDEPAVAMTAVLLLFVLTHMADGLNSENEAAHLQDQGFINKAAHPSAFDISADNFVTTQDVLTKNQVRRYNKTIEDFDRDMMELVTWGEKHGLFQEDPPIKIVYDWTNPEYLAGRSRPNLRIVASRDVKKGDLLLSVPLSLCVSATQAAAQAPLNDRGFDSWQFTPLAAWILRERAKGKGSEWAPYVALLPDYVASPLVYTEEGLAEIEDRVFLEQALQVRQLVADIFESSNRSALAHASLEDFHWAMTVAMSRAVPGQINSKVEAAAGDEPKVDDDGWEEEEEEGTVKEASRSKGKEEEEKKEEERQPPLLLVPFGDFFDHSDSANVRWEVSADSVSFFATSDVSASSPLSVSYGKGANDHFFLFYGFVPDENSHEGAALFQKPSEAISFFRENFLQGRWSDMHQAGADDTFEILEYKLGLEMTENKDKYEQCRVEAGAEYRLDEGWPYFVWSGGKLDPRLFGAFAAIHAIFLNNKAIDYASISKVALSYAWKLPHSPSSCDGFAPLLPDSLSDSFPPSGAAVMLRCQQALSEFSRTIRQDLEELQGLLHCKAQLGLAHENAKGLRWHQVQQLLLQEVSGDASQLSACANSEEVVGRLAERESTLRFKIGKKEVLLEMIKRLRDTCEN